MERSNSTGYPKLRLVYQLGSDFQGWIAGSVKLLSFAMPCPVKVFAGNDLPAADAWIVR